MPDIVSDQESSKTSNCVAVVFTADNIVTGLGLGSASPSGQNQYQNFVRLLPKGEAEIPGRVQHGGEAGGEMSKPSQGGQEALPTPHPRLCLQQT